MDRIAGATGIRDLSEPIPLRAKPDKKGNGQPGLPWNGRWNGQWDYLEGDIGNFSSSPIFRLGLVRYPASMRTADDFDAYYAKPDPWGVASAAFRDRVLRARLTRAVRKKTVLELGCGEGHLTQAVFHRARSVTAVDISDVAITRARALNLRNASFKTADLLDVSFGGYDVIAAIECVQYLSFAEQEAFFRKVASEHSGKMLFLSGPIIDHQKHFGHRRLLQEFKATGFKVVGFHNLSVYWHPLSARMTGELLKMPLGHTLLDWLPERMIHQRLYALRAP